MLYKVTTQYLKCMLKRTRSDGCTATPVVRSVRQFLGLRVGTCVGAGVCVCLCAFRSAVARRGPLRGTGLRNITLFLPALSMICVFILKKKSQTFLCIWRSVLPAYMFYINTLCGIEIPNTPTTFVAFGPFFPTLIPCSPVFSKPCTTLRCGVAMPTLPGVVAIAS